MKPYRVHRGVKIYRNREQIPGSGLREKENGDMVPCKPKFYPPVYQFHKSFPYDTLKECKQSIDEIHRRCIEVGAETRPKEFAAIMNGETPCDP